MFCYKFLMFPFFVGNVIPLLARDWALITKNKIKLCQDKFIDSKLYLTWLIYPLWTSMCSKGLIGQHTPSSTRHEEFQVSFCISFHCEHSPDIVYFFVFLSTHPSTLDDFVWCHAWCGVSLSLHTQDSVRILCLV